MTKRRPDAGAVLVVVPAGSGVWLKSRLRRYSASLRGEWRNGVALRDLGDLAGVFAGRAGIDLSQLRMAATTDLEDVIARSGATKQSTTARAWLDCFASLA